MILGPRPPAAERNEPPCSHGDPDSGRMSGKTCRACRNYHHDYQSQIYVYTYIYVCVCVYVYIKHTYIHTYVHTYIHIHTYIHTYIHTNIRTLKGNIYQLVPPLCDIYICM